jgi:hypothetical protein
MQYVTNFDLTLRSLRELIKKKIQKTASYCLFWIQCNKFLKSERNHLEDPSVDRRIVLRWIFRKLDGAMDWIDLAWDMDRWLALVNAEINFRVLRMRGIS